MPAATESVDPPLTTITQRLKDKSFAIILILINTLLAFSLISFDIRDSSVVSGTSEAFAVYNWIGIFGAKFSASIFLSIGMAAYPAVLLLFACTLRHLFGKTYQANGIYFGGYCLFVVGTSMLLGTYPEFLSSICAVLNLRELPGGALGSTLCHPLHGWLTLILHPLGCTLVAISMIAIGGITIWLYDWQFYCRKLIKALKEDPMTVSLQESQKIVTESFKDKEKPYENSTVNHIMSKASTVFGWMKVKQGTQLDTLQRLEVERKQQTLNESHSQLNLDQDTVADLPPVETSEPAVAQKPPRAEPTSRPVDFEPELLDEEPLPDIISGQDIDTPSTLAGGTRYKVPGFNVISKVEELVTVDQKEIARKREILQETLDSFRIKAITGNAMAGPRVTLFEIIPEKGVKVEKIANLNNNIAMELQAEKVRILAPIPGRRSVGIEVPNDDSSPVCFRSLLETKEFRNSKAMIPVILGKDIAGKAIVMDLAKAPHLLIAGATGAGKSVFMNTLILSLLYRFSPEELQLIMVDPKFVELTGYNTIPHLVCPVITDPQRVPSALRWAVFEMDCRYQMLAAVGVKHLEAFNNRKKKPNEPTSDCNGNKIPDKLPLTVIIIDELADLMMMAKKEIETSIARIAQKARAVGIHLVIATQRPSVDVVTGIIKANFPTRIAFKVSSLVDSKTILDRKGAEQLLGMGDMLFMPPGSSNIIRIQGAWVKDDDIEKIVNYCTAQQPQEFQDIFKLVEDSDEEPASKQGELFGTPEVDGNGDEELIEKAIEIIRRDKRASTSHIQRRLRIGYNRAATIMEALEDRDIVGPQTGSAKREINFDAIESGDF